MDNDRQSGRWREKGVRYYGWVNGDRQRDTVVVAHIRTRKQTFLKTNSEKGYEAAMHSDPTMEHISPNKKLYKKKYNNTESVHWVVLNIQHEAAIRCNTLAAAQS
jgi:hypothetical protein